MRVDISSLTALRAAIRDADSSGWHSQFAGDLAMAVHGELSFGRLGQRFNHGLASGDVAEHTVADVWTALQGNVELLVDADNPLGLIYRIVHGESVRFFMTDEGYASSARRAGYACAESMAQFRVDSCSIDDPLTSVDCRPLDYPVDRSRLAFSIDDIMGTEDSQAYAPVLRKFVSTLESAGLDNAVQLVSTLTEIAAATGAVYRRNIRSWADRKSLAARLEMDESTVRTVVGLMFPRSERQDQCLLHLIARSVTHGERLRIPFHIHQALRSLRSTKLDAQVISIPPPVREFSQPVLQFDLGLAS